MSSYTLGIDTSNYATSLAVFDTAGEVVCAKKRFLPVKEGQLGLRQSDALFHHTAALPEMLKELSGEFDLTKISAVGVSEKPRPVEGSYMPCFLAGVSAAEAFALGKIIDFYNRAVDIIFESRAYLADALELGNNIGYIIEPSIERNGMKTLFAQEIERLLMRAEFRTLYLLDIENEDIKSPACGHF